MKIENIHYSDHAKELINSFPKGILLLTKYKENINIMTIGWCLLGYMWNRPIFQTIIRTSRFTFNLIGKSKNFSVNVPLKDKMKEEILFCGTNSGIDINKIKKCRFTISNSQLIDSPIISNCDLFLECKVIAKLPIENINDNHFHMMYYGEIVLSYIKGGNR